MATDQSETELALRRRAEHDIAISDAEWAWARGEEGLVQACLGDPGDEDCFEDLLRSIGRLPGRRPGGRRPVALHDRIDEPVNSEPSAREKAVSQLLALEAAGAWAVKSFRRRFLHRRCEPGGVRLLAPENVVFSRGEAGSVQLLAPEEVHPWISVKTAGEPTQWAEVPLPEKGEREIALPWPGNNHRHLIYEAPTATAGLYRSPGGWQVHGVATIDGGPLEDLRALADSLHGSYGWSEPAAATWVLTGVVPNLSEIMWRRDARDPSAASRIVLTVDPTVRPDELAAEYRRVRTRFMLSPHRDMGNKHLALAVFVAERPDEPWKESMGRWNEAYPGWAYTNYKQFWRDGSGALPRLRDPGHTLRYGVAGKPEA